MARLMESLSNQSEAWRLLETAEQAGHFPHALAFTGASESLDLAWAFAQRLLCENPQPPCGVCGPCVRVANRQSEGVLLIEPEKGLIKLESAHRIGEFLGLKRMTKARIVLIQDAQSLNVQATNAILKLVEEPPPESYFIFVVPEISLLLPTLRSRIQVVRLRAKGRAWPEEARDWSGPLEAFLKGCFNRDRAAVAEFFLQASDRAATESAVRALQLMLRDWAVDGEPLNADVSFKGWPELPVRKKVNLWRRAWAMEQDLMAHVDRTLVFENFFLQVTHELD